MPRVATALALSFLAISGCGADEPAESGGATSQSGAEEIAEPGFGSIAIEDLEGCGNQPGRPDYRCGSIEVPFERSDPSYGTTEIGFAVLPASGKGPSDGAIFAVEGGPGYPSTGTAQAYRSLFGDELLAKRDLVLVDQRGQGRSEPYDCPGLQRGLGPEEITLAACAERLGKQFISYRTSAAADDIDSVREALGYEEIALYGDSYGTFLGQSYAYRHPDRLEALVLDSAYPAFGEDPWYPSLPRTGIRSLDKVCERSARCEGDAGNRLARAARLLRSSGRGTGSLITALIDAAYGPPATYRAIDSALKSLLDGRGGPYRNLVRAGRPGAGDPAYYSRAGELVVGCNDYPMIWEREADEPERRAQLEEAIQDYPKAEGFKPFTAREIAYAAGTSYLECLTWPKPTDVYEPPVDPETQEPTEAPVLVVSGELDDVTTPLEGKTVAGFFEDAEHFVAPNAGHVNALYYFNRPAAREIRGFLERELP